MKRPLAVGLWIGAISLVLIAAITIAFLLIGSPRADGPVATPEATESPSPTQSAAPTALVCAPDDASTAPAAADIRAPEALRSETLPGSTFNGYAVGQAIIADTQRDRTYAAWFDASGVLQLAVRSGDLLRDGRWSVTQPRIDGEVVSLEGDSHNSLSLGLDPSGNVHLVGNVHTQVLQYWRTSTAGDLSTLKSRDEVAGTMYSVGYKTHFLVQNTEMFATYPTFVNDRSGTLFLMYRNGEAGRGNTWLYRYTGTSPEKSKWENAPTAKESPGILFGGIRDEDAHSAYPSTPVLGADGVFRMSWVWRSDVTADTNSRLSYATSKDLIHWTSVGGDKLSMPIRYDSAPAAVVDDVPEHGGLLNNQVQIGVDTDNGVAVSYFRYVEDPQGTRTTQIMVARRNEKNTKWVLNQVSAFTGIYDLTQKLGESPPPLNLLFPGALRQVGAGRYELEYSCASTRFASRTISLSDARASGELTVTHDGYTTVSFLPLEIRQAVDGRAPRSFVTDPITDRLGRSFRLVLGWMSGAASVGGARPDGSSEGSDLTMYVIAP